MQVTAKFRFTGELMIILERLPIAARTVAGGKGAPWRRTLDASAAHAKSAAAPASREAERPFASLGVRA
jgi:hypothetical protein